MGQTITAKRSRNTSWKRIAIAMLAVATWPCVAWIAAELLVVHASVAKADAIVVMSGSATFRERTQHAGMLYKQGRATKIILTNDHLQASWSSGQQRNPYYYELALDELLRAGVPDNRVAVIMEPITSTYDEAVVLKKYCQTNRITSLLIVTSAYHSRRALWTFRRVFKDTGISIGIDPASTGNQTPTPGTWWLHKFGWEAVADEYGKMIIYWLRY